MDLRENLESSYCKFRGAALKQGWWNLKAPVLLAVSGGSDSMGMLLLFKEYYRGEFAVAHLNHGIRGETAERDASFVRGMCDRLGVRCFVENVSVPDEKCQGESIEEAARRMRHGFLIRTMESEGFDFIALGHTADDLAENVLMNTLRGGGLWSLAGMPIVRAPFVRPVIGFTRHELANLVIDKGWNWVEDETNFEDAYLRNRIRNRVLPMLTKEINARSAFHLASLAEEMNSWRELDVVDAKRDLEAVMVKDSSDDVMVSLRIKDLRKLHRMAVARLVRYLGRRFSLESLSRSRTDSLVGLIFSSGRWTFQWKKDVVVSAGDGFVNFVNLREI